MLIKKLDIDGVVNNYGFTPVALRRNIKMKLTTRSSYGLQAVLELAMHYGEKPIPRKEIASNLKVSYPYLEPLFKNFQAAGIVSSVSGPRGGSKLVKHPKDITLYDIITLCDGRFLSISCSEHKKYSSKCSECMTQRAFKLMKDGMYSLLKATSLQDLIDKK